MCECVCLRFLKTWLYRISWKPKTRRYFLTSRIWNRQNLREQRRRRDAVVERHAVFGKKTKQHQFFFDVSPFSPHLHVVVCTRCAKYMLFFGEGNVFLLFFFLLNMRMLSRRVIIRNTHTHTYKGEKHAFSRSYSCPHSYILVPFWLVYNNIDEITKRWPHLLQNKKKWLFSLFSYSALSRSKMAEMIENRKEQHMLMRVWGKMGEEKKRSFEVEQLSYSTRCNSSSHFQQKSLVSLSAFERKFDCHGVVTM